MVKKPIREFILRNVEADDLINQAKGLRAVKQRKRGERLMLNVDKYMNQQVKLKLKDADRPTKRQKLSDQIQRGFDIATKWKAMTYRELAEQLIMDGYFMPDFSWQQYEEDLRWDLHIDEKVLEQYAEEHNIILKEE